MKTQIKRKLVATMIFVVALIADAQIKPGIPQRGLAKTTAGLPYVLMNANNVTTWVHSDGFFNWLVSQSWNGEFPIGSGVGTIFSEGIVFGGFVNDGLYPQNLRANGVTYVVGMQPGAIVTNSSGNTVGTDDPASLSSRAFAVRPDMPLYLAGDTAHWPNLNADAASFLQKSADSVTATDRLQIAGQYFQDWNEWPAAKGAPWFIDSVRIVRNDAGFDPTNLHHLPGIPDAAKTVWFVCNDQNPAVTESFAGSPPMGIEEQMTLWAYNLTGALDPLNNIIFKQVKLIYKGNPGAPQNSRIDSMYIGQWSDPDVGDGGNDFIGCDSLLSFGFAYNSQVSDIKYSQVGLMNPSTGFAILQGTTHYTGNPTDSAAVNFQWRKGYATWTERPLTSFLFGTGASDALDDIVTYGSTPMWYNLLRGYLPRPAYPSGIPYYTCAPYAISHNFATLYAYSGDPVTQSGWIDGIDVPAGDRRMLSNHGPFSLRLHDTAEVIVALVDALGGDNLWSLQILKYNVTFAQYSYSIALNSSSVSTSVAPTAVPRSFHVFQNFPNPFNPATTIRYQIPFSGTVTIKVFNVLGQEIATLLNEFKQAGRFTVEWNASKFPSGVYFYRTEIAPLTGNAGHFRDVKKMIVLK